MMLLRTDYSAIKSERIGRGTVGMKTSELDRFSALLDRHGIGRLPGIAFTIETLGKDAGKDNLEPQVERLVREKINEFAGFGLVIRADERTAKGVGLPNGTEFIFISPEKIDQSVDNAIVNVEMVLLSQWEKTAVAFRKKTGLKDGIGIVLMPLAGENFEYLGMEHFGPIISLKGMTIIKNGEAIVEAGFGIPNGARYQRGNPSSWLSPLKWYNEYERIYGRFFRNGIEGGLDTKRYELEMLKALDVYRFAGNGIDNIVQEMINLAKDHGSDIYFELQSIDIEHGGWVCTQITDHEWKPVQRPEGKIVLEVAGRESVIGTGVVKCNGFEQRLGPPSESGKLEGVKFELKNAFLDYSGTPAILYTRSNMARAFASHLSGIYREAGILILNYAKQVKAGWPEPDKQLMVWADEVNEIGGIVIPK